MKYIFNIIVTIAVVVAVVLGWLIAQKYLHERAVQGCLEVGYEEYNNPAQNSKAVTFNKQAYEFCMGEKGRN